MVEKIVVLDAMSIPESFPLPRPSFAHEWVSYQTTAPADIVARAKDATYVLTNKCKMTAEVLSQLPNLKYIGELATGFNNIDIAWCKEHGVAVTNIQGYSTDSVAEHTFAMFLTLSRSFIGTRKAMENGAWVNAPVFCLLPGGPITDLKGHTLTVVGNGSIGKRIAEIAKVFGMRVLKAEHKGAETIREGYTDFTTAIKEADFITVNCPLNAQTNNLIGNAEFNQMKQSVIIVNNARGGVVNEQELADAVLSRRIKAAAADVSSVEPLPERHPYTMLLKCDNFLLTPHQAWMSDACLTELVRQAGENMEVFHQGGAIRRIV